jgi:hypothetical protein
MQLTIQDMGSIGEFIAAIATLVTLVYLAVQIRQNTSSVRASMFQESVRDMAVAGDVLSSDAELAKIWWVGAHDFDALQPDERLRFAAYALSLFRRMENIFYQTQHGALDSGFGESVIGSVHIMRSQAGVVAWWGRARVMFSPGFREYVGREFTPGIEHASQNGGGK